MAQDMTLAVLRYRPAEMSADAEKGGRRLRDRIATNRSAADDYEAAALEQNLVTDQRKALAQLRQRKIVPVNGDVVDAAAHDPCNGSIELHNLGVGQPV